VSPPPTRPAGEGPGSTEPGIDDLLDHLDALVAEIDTLPDDVGGPARALTEVLYLIHRSAVGHLVEALGDDEVRRLMHAHPAVRWLFEVYQADLEGVPGGMPAGAGAATPPPSDADPSPVASVGSPR
jgi:hypothetical protein